MAKLLEGSKFVYRRRQVIEDSQAHPTPRSDLPEQNASRCIHNLPHRLPFPHFCRSNGPDVIIGFWMLKKEVAVLLHDLLQLLSPLGGELSVGIVLSGTRVGIEQEGMSHGSFAIALPPLCLSPEEGRSP